MRKIWSVVGMLYIFICEWSIIHKYVCYKIIELSLKISASMHITF